MTKLKLNNRGFGEDAVHVWTDGSCVPNPGKGGWAAVIRWRDGRVEERTGGDAETTNNRMELTAAIRALEALPAGCQVVLHTDSEYLAKGITLWLPGWERRGWRTADGSPVRNADLWVSLIKATSTRQVEWRWVRGHADVEMNVRADRLANAARKAAI
ncbi:ribonuclease HI [Falsiroseomonas sp. HC035]|uniref:ribonuclease HI n=1 Tax=Falsiroseomonas sp. HC035 TaxID=3390999 RepID=UPI003D314422